MDPVVIVILGKIACALVALGGAIYIVRCGFAVFRSGGGAAPGDIFFHIGTFQVKARSAGAVIMATACVWAWIAVAFNPDFDKKGEEIRVYSLIAPEGEVILRSVAVKIPRNESGAPVNADQLKALLTRGVENANIKPSEGLPRINGLPATIDLSTINAMQTASGKIRLSAKVESTNDSAIVQFEPKLESGKVTFFPSSVDTFDKQPQQHE